MGYGLIKAGLMIFWLARFVWHDVCTNYSVYRAKMNLDSSKSMKQSSPGFVFLPKNKSYAKEATHLFYYRFGYLCLRLRGGDGA